MKIIECDFPPASLLDRQLVDAAYYRDSYRAPLCKREASVTDIFHAIFAHRPVWMKLLFIIRNRVVALWGIHAEPTSKVMNPQLKQHYKIGDTIGAWPIFTMTENELIAGRDDKHLDFRVSIMRERVGEGENEGSTSSVIVSTVCTVHNTFGKIYLFFIIPFHQLGAKWLIAQAIKAGRL